MPVYDYNGQVFEMDETDPAAARAKIQAALGETPEIQAPPAQEFGVGELTQMLAPAATSSQVQMVPTTVPVAPQAGGMGPPSQTTPVKAQMAPTGAGQLVEDIRGAKVMQPLTQNLAGRFSDYVAKPAKAVIDAATMITTGIPGAAPAALYDTYKAATEAVPRMRQALGAMQLDEKLYSELANKLNPKEMSQLSDLVGKMGGKAALEAFELPARLASDPAAVQAYNAIRSQAQAAPGMASKLAGPILRGAARVAGPVGMGMDIYQAQQFAEESQLGPRLAQGQGRRAQQAFRNMAANTQYGGLTPEQQQMLEQDKIDQAIRRKAAQKVLGPVIPPGQ